MMQAKIPVPFWGTDSDEFERFVGRQPKDAKELIEFARLISKGIDGQLDWTILCQCAAEALPK